MLAFVLVYRLVCGLIAVAIANGKGRSAVGWFFAGFFLDLIGIIVVAVLPNLKEQRAYRESVELENRRLREQLRQERTKGEAFRQYSTGRLDSHDKALGMDTRSPDALSAGTTVEPPELVPPPVPRPDSVLWYYEENGESRGPISASQVKQMLWAKRIGGDTLLWTEDLGDWTPAREVPHFQTDVRS